MILLVLEFGGVLLLNIGVADGDVYLFAGIYIRKDYGNVQIKGYLTCGGSLNILDLVTATVTFYLGLEGNGKYVEGYCTLSIEIKIAAFITISVGLSMYKRIYGSSDNTQSPDQTNAQEDADTMAARNLRVSAPATARKALAPVNNDIPHNSINKDIDWKQYFDANFH